MKPRKIEGGCVRISILSFRKNRFCALLKCVSFIFILNICVSDSIFQLISQGQSHVTLKYRIVREGAERGALQTVLVDHQYTND